MGGGVPAGAVRTFDPPNTAEPGPGFFRPGDAAEKKTSTRLGEKTIRLEGKEDDTEAATILL